MTQDTLSQQLNDLFYRHTDYYEDGSGSEEHWAIGLEDFPKLLEHITHERLAAKIEFVLYLLENTKPFPNKYYGVSTAQLVQELSNLNRQKKALKTEKAK